MAHDLHQRVKYEPWLVYAVSPVGPIAKGTGSSVADAFFLQLLDAGETVRHLALTRAPPILIILL